MNFHRVTLADIRIRVTAHFGAGSKPQNADRSTTLEERSASARTQKHETLFLCYLLIVLVVVLLLFFWSGINVPLNHKKRPTKNTPNKKEEDKQTDSAHWMEDTVSALKLCLDLVASEKAENRDRGKPQDPGFKGSEGT